MLVALAEYSKQQVSLGCFMGMYGKLLLIKEVGSLYNKACKTGYNPEFYCNPKWKETLLRWSCEILSVNPIVYSTFFYVDLLIRFCSSHLLSLFFIGIYNSFCAFLKIIKSIKSCLCSYSA